MSKNKEYIEKYAEYAMEQMHKGIDIQAKHDEIFATEDKGKVIKVNNNTDGGAGRYVTVEYSRPLATQR